MRQGDRRGTEMDFYDFTYDGFVNDGHLTDGLGQLTDFEDGSTNFRLDLQNLGKKGYEWVAWKNDTPAAPPVEIVFRFEQVRNFTAVRINANNFFSKEVGVFSRVDVYASVGGAYYVAAPVVYEYLKDSAVEFARLVVIPLPNLVGRYIKLVLHFDTRWLMISEIRFESGERRISYAECSAFWMLWCYAALAQMFPRLSSDKT